MSQNMRDNKRSAAFPWLNGRPTHLPCGPGDMPSCVLLPGDPDRVTLAAALLDNARDFGRRREFHAVRGDWRGSPVGVCSTGVGGPSAEIAVVELANLDVTSVIRVGGMGALQADLPLGGFLIVDQAEGATGAAAIYGATGAVNASADVVDALEEAARTLGFAHRRGRVHTTDSYYWGQGRSARPDGRPSPTPDIVSRLAAQGVCGLDMEAQTVFAVAKALGLRAGAVLAVHGNRATDEWLEDYEETQANLIRLAATAAALLGSN
ncbi:nucleoside phosphorylase [Terrarubrum flagellatum]|uniref:nucleoside phosphorylase n=1 Tax=Terrirubrum flagellatum TaxID=2895980 RepID=UPI0031454F8E